MRRGDVVVVAVQGDYGKPRPAPPGGLRLSSQIAIDKMTVVPVEKIRKIIGAADAALLVRVSGALAVFLSIV